MGAGVGSVDEVGGWDRCVTREGGKGGEAERCGDSVGQGVP